MMNSEAREWNVCKVNNVINYLESDHRFENDGTDFSKRAKDIISECITELECLVSDNN